jgi:hypothetical protein
LLDGENDSGDDIDGDATEILGAAAGDVGAAGDDGVWLSETSIFWRRDLFGD